MANVLKNQIIVVRIVINIEIGALFPEFMFKKFIKYSDELFLTLVKCRKPQKYAMLVVPVTY